MITFILLSLLAAAVVYYLCVVHDLSYHLATLWAWLGQTGDGVYAVEASVETQIQRGVVVGLALSVCLVVLVALI